MTKVHLKPDFIKEFDLNGGFSILACSAMGICSQTYNNWRKNDNEFKQICEDIVDKHTDLAKQTIQALAMKEKHFPALKYIVETRGFRQRENEVLSKIQVETGHEFGNDVTTLAILERKVAELKAVLKAKAEKDEAQ